MTDLAKLAVLKQDLQLITSAHDVYLLTLLELAQSAIETEGIVCKEDDIECDMAIIQYAAYLFRRRASNETIMPRFLRYQLNQLLFAQKTGGEAH